MRLAARRFTAATSRPRPTPPTGTEAARPCRMADEHEWHSLSEMPGNMNLLKVPDPEAYERANYMLMLQTWRH